MTEQEKLIQNIADTPAPIIGNGLISEGFTQLNLSVYNRELSSFDIANWVQCQAYIDRMLNKNRTRLAIGGYLEKRNLYDNSPNFSRNTLENRNIHLGTDIWAPSGTPILTPADGVIHSFADNKGPGNYGPTVILEHKTDKLSFYTLYGHLSRESIRGIERRKQYLRGEKLAELGTPEENGNYAPHLHFQIILDLEGFEGDYPGVCGESTLEHYKQNCPNPDLLLKILSRNID